MCIYCPARIISGRSKLAEVAGGVLDLDGWWDSNRGQVLIMGSLNHEEPLE
jgi:hypothetical protein